MSLTRHLNPRTLPLIITTTLFVALFGFGAISYDAFLSPQVFLNLLIDNGFLLVVAIGMTFVIISGGIDLSVGSIVALTTMVSASLVQHHHWSIWVILPLVLLMGCAFGLLHGVLIQVFRLQAFIVTLGGMFLARGLCYVISIDSISITDPTYTALSEYRLALGEETFISLSGIIALVTLAIAIFIAHYTKFGRTVYAIGGNERSALLMGLPVARTKIMVYVLSGFCSALGGILVTLYMLSGYGLHALGMELDAIAAAVIGGTLLTGGVGNVIGTLIGVLILGVIQSLIAFDGSLSSWWTRIAIGLLLFLFCLLQRIIERSGLGRKAKSTTA
ncbi:galactofuranose ABC transporter, permease protein YjfF [Uliginosibacterium gangwonense]|uniref:galactofuranose ABC transporter, permease protein YjfF n=1 Tax=Uliginosibacterium gangwonense TaxID=392736 RepID=UPI00035FF1BF|nr:galactofuranose ABC transporter, permease protein YjfF [Uliginosibacterium gangwonense]